MVCQLSSFKKQLVTLVMTKKIFLKISILVVALIPFSTNEGDAQSLMLNNFERSKLSILSKSKSHEFLVEKAKTERQQSQGLMFRRRLASNGGMLFLFPAVKVLKMWMKNTYLPLDMLFINADGRIVNIVQRTVPGSLETISSVEPAMAVLEVNGGTTSRLKIQKGDRVRHHAFRINYD